MTQEMGYGVGASPYLVSVHPGQRINFTLLDFNSPSSGLTIDNTMENEHFTGKVLVSFLQQWTFFFASRPSAGQPRYSMYISWI